MEEVGNLLLIYTADRTRASREKAAIALYNLATGTAIGKGPDPECWLFDILAEASQRLHQATRDVLDEVDQLYC